ncbi:MAG: AMP-binding protein, partial [Caldimonas sp.]
MRTDWIATPHFRPDHRGPRERAFVPFADPAESPSILQILRRCVDRHPDAIAIECDGKATSYERLWRDAMALAGEIGRVGDDRGAVGILLPGDASYVAALFACLLAGRLCVLLDEGYPASRTRQIVARTGLEMLICPAGFAPAGDWPPLRFLGVRPGVQPAGDGVEPTGAALGLDEPAFILCTSGSTGQPKAIAHSQRTMLHWARTTHEALHVRPDDRVLSLSSLSTLGGLTGLLNFVLAGVCVQMCDVKSVGLAGLLDTLARRPVTVFRAAPSLLKSLVRVPEAERSLSRLRAVQTYGEPLLKADLHAWQPLLPAGCHVRTTYGSTEASGLSWFAGAGDDYDPIRVAAGVLMPDTLAAIVDDDGASCARGEVGELLIRSRYNALGEWVDGRIDTALFAPHDTDDGSRIFATHDLALCHPDGVFVVQGRLDRMAKINGQRLDPSEIEAVLRAQVGV